MLIIRALKNSETAILKDALYDAIFIPEGAEKLPRSIIDVPEINRYVSGFGRAGDFCLVAELNGQIVGVIWIRMFTKAEPGYGYIDNKTPELSMSVTEAQRNRGIGQQLLTVMLNEIEKRGYKQVSLSVDEVNYAYGFYKKNGFIDYATVGGSITMVREM